MTGADRFGDAGILVVGHGTADPLGAGETRCLTAGVAALAAGVPVELGFLEVIEPGVAEGLRRLRDGGCRVVVAAPLLLFGAGHARRDLPAAIATAAAELGIEVVQAGHLGAHPRMLWLSHRRRAEALGGGTAALAFAVRGSSDPTTPDQARGFLDASLALDPSPPERTAVGFVAAARPSVPESLDLLAATGARRVLVQPHLLFRGQVEGEIVAAVEAARERHPAVEWITAGRLGPDPAVAEALFARAAEAVTRRRGA